MKKRAKITFLTLILIFLFSWGNFAQAGDQILTNIDEILQANPLPVGEKIHLITIVQDDTITLAVVRILELGEIKPHFHKKHNESVYVVRGSGQMLIKGKWVEVKPGTIHFNPKTKVHSIKNTGCKELVVIAIFTPGLKEPDRHFVE